MELVLFPDTLTENMENLCFLKNRLYKAGEKLLKYRLDCTKVSGSFFMVLCAVKVSFMPGAVPGRNRSYMFRRS